MVRVPQENEPRQPDAPSRVYCQAPWTDCLGGQDCEAALHCGWMAQTQDCLVSYASSSLASTSSESQEADESNPSCACVSLEKFPSKSCRHWFIFHSCSVNTPLQLKSLKTKVKINKLSLCCLQGTKIMCSLMPRPTLTSTQPRAITTCTPWRSRSR